MTFRRELKPKCVKHSGIVTKCRECGATKETTLNLQEGVKPEPVVLITCASCLAGRTGVKPGPTRGEQSASWYEAHKLEAKFQLQLRRAGFQFGRQKKGDRPKPPITYEVWLHHVENDCGWLCSDCQKELNRETGILTLRVPATEHEAFALSNLVPRCRTCANRRAALKRWAAVRKTDEIDDCHECMIDTPYIDIEEKIASARTARTGQRDTAHQPF